MRLIEQVFVNSLGLVCAWIEPRRSDRVNILLKILTQHRLLLTAHVQSSASGPLSIWPGRYDCGCISSSSAQTCAILRQMDTSWNHWKSIRAQFFVNCIRVRREQLMQRADE